MEKAAFPTEWILRKKKTYFFGEVLLSVCVWVGSAFTRDPAESHIFIFDSVIAKADIYL